MKDSGIQLRGEETEALAIVFGDWQRDVDYQKWWRSLGVNPPGDYTDPELLFDQLPQPYRTITKVLEQDIIDPSWDIITDRHPELLLVQPENHTGPLLELENIVTPSVSTTAVGAVTALQTIGTGSNSGPDYNSPFTKFMLTGSSSGHVSVVDSSGAVISSLFVGEVLANAAVAGIDPLLLSGKGRGITALSNVSDNPTHPLRFVACLADVVSESVVQPASTNGGEKGTSAKGGEVGTDEAPSISSTLALFELWPVLQTKEEIDTPAVPGSSVSGGVGGGNASVNSIGGGDGAGGAGGGSNGNIGSTGGDGDIDGVEVERPKLVLVSASTLNEPTAIVEVALAADGLFLSTSFADGSVKVHALPPRPVLPTVNDDDDKGKMEKIPEDVEANDGDAAAALFGDAGKIVPFFPPLIELPAPAPPPTYAGEETPDAAAASAWPRSLVGKCIFLQAASSGPGISDIGPERDRLATSAFVIWRQGSNVLRKYLLPGSKSLSAISAAATAAVKAADSVDDAPPEELQHKLEDSVTAAADSVALLSEFTFAGALTTIATVPVSTSGTGPTTQLLGLAAIGTADGSVFLWDLNQGMTRAILGAHHTTITSLAFHQGTRLFSGSADGVMHAYELFPPALTAAQQAQLAQNTKNAGGATDGTEQSASMLEANFDYGSGFLQPYLIKVSWHLKEPLVWLASTSSLALLYAQGASGTIAVYDVSDVTLIGECFSIL